MHPAPSIIVFTVLSGIGYGFAAFLGLGFLDPSLGITKFAHFLALAMIAGGLLSSTLHLGNPQRAWRAFSQWRSSWLSREGVMAIVTFVPLTLNAAMVTFNSEHSMLLGVIGAICCLITVYCTSMIYASLKSVDAWHTQLTPLCFIAFSIMGGALMTLLFNEMAGNAKAINVLAIVFALAALAGFLAKKRWRKRMRMMAPTSTPESATGLGFIGKVRSFEHPHMTDNYLTKEMGFKVARKHANKLTKIYSILLFIVPLIMVLIAPMAPGALTFILLLVAVFSAIVGLLVERWLFFAEAKHAVANYY